MQGCGGPQTPSSQHVCGGAITPWPWQALSFSHILPIVAVDRALSKQVWGTGHACVVAGRAAQSPAEVPKPLHCRRLRPTGHVLLPTRSLACGVGGWDEEPWPVWPGPVSWEAALLFWGSAGCRSRDPSWVLCSWGLLEVLGGAPSDTGSDEELSLTVPRSSPVTAVRETCSWRLG